MESVWIGILEKIAPEVILMLIVAFVSYCVIEFVKAVLKSVKKENIYIPKEILRWMNAFLGFILSYLFDFRLVDRVFQSLHPGGQAINPFICYLVNAVIMYKFSYLFYKYFMKITNGGMDLERILKEKLYPAQSSETPSEE